MKELIIKSIEKNLTSNYKNISDLHADINIISMHNGILSGSAKILVNEMITDNACVNLEINIYEIEVLQLDEVIYMHDIEVNILNCNDKELDENDIYYNRSELTKLTNSTLEFVLS